MIYTFTGTGNSKFVAEEIAKITKEETFSINDALKHGLAPAPGSDDEKIIIVCPTYAWRVPKVVDAWIKKTDFGPGKKIWFVMTCGGEIGDAAGYNQATAKEKGLIYMGSKGIKLPDNYIIMFKPVSQETADALFASAKVDIENVAKRISGGQKLDRPRRNIYDKAMSSLVNPLFYKNVKADDYSAGDSCNACGLCVALCPLNNISLKDEKPVWGESCTHCMACISYCPKAAIEYGKKTVGKRRYTVESYRKNSECSKKLCGCREYV